MPAPTALQRAPEPLSIEETTHDAGSSAIPEGIAIATSNQPLEPSEEQRQSQDEPSTESMDVDAEHTDRQPLFTPEKASKAQHRVEERKIRIPPHRMTPLKTNWPKIYPPLVEHLKLQVRMNIAKKAVELRTSPHTTSTASIQKGADFITAFTLGFDLDDAIALLRLDDL